jgi:raffinose/stachyose/melibiose transport system substrate-binding protein
MQDWGDKGYFMDGFSGIGYDDSNKYSRCEGAMTISGSWQVGGFSTDTDQDLWLLLCLPMKETRVWPSRWGIRSRSQDHRHTLIWLKNTLIGW